MHDGRAQSLEDAIALHGGEAENSARGFHALSTEEKSKLVDFLHTLVAPTPIAAR
jgi:CxxC motif-containing protein (DUF1111 family)